MRIRSTVLVVALVAAALSVSGAAIPAPEGPEIQTSGKGTFRTAAGGTGIIGHAGELRTYCVQVEEGITGFQPGLFALQADRVLADRRSWIAAGKWRFQRVGDCSKAYFLIQLTTPDTVDKMCGSAGLDTKGEVSCNYGNHVVINLKRWTLGVPHYRGDLAGYRNMVLNHEVGHDLGLGHSSCPGPGKPAPVMQQQTYSLQGCAPNPYPFPESKP